MISIELQIIKTIPLELTSLPNKPYCHTPFLDIHSLYFFFVLCMHGIFLEIFQDVIIQKTREVFVHAQHGVSALSAGNDPDPAVSIKRLITLELN